MKISALSIIFTFKLGKTPLFLEVIYILKKAGMNSVLLFMPEIGVFSFWRQIKKYANYSNRP